MCDLQTIGIVFTAMQAVGSISAGVSQQRAAQANAAAITSQAAYEERLQREQAARVMGAARAATAASGLVLTGSALDVIADSAAAAEMDALAIRASGRQRAAVALYEGRAALMGGIVGAGSAILSGVSAWQKFPGSPAGPAALTTTPPWRLGPGARLAGGV